MINERKFYTASEWDALEYFNVIGSYKKYQNVKESPSIFDSRESFLRKMHHSEWHKFFFEKIYQDDK